MTKQLVTVIGLLFCVNSILAQSGWRVYQAPNDLPDSTVVQYSVQGDSLIVTDELGFYIQTRNSREFFNSNDGYEDEPFLSVTANTNNELCVLYDHADSLYIYENHQLKRKIAIGGWWSKCRDDNITIVPGLDGYFYANCDGYVYVPNGDVLDLISGSRRMRNMIQGPDNSVYAIKNDDSAFYKIRNGNIIDTTEVPDSLVSSGIYYWTSNSEQIIFQGLFNHLYSFKPGANPEISISRKTDKGIYRFALDDQNRIWFTRDFLINRLSLADTSKEVEQVSGFKMSHNLRNTSFTKTFGDEILAVFDGGYITATTDVRFHEMDYLTLNDFNIPVYPEGSFGTNYYLPDDFRKITYKDKSILFSDKLWVSGESKSTGIDYFSGSDVIGYNNNNDDYFIGFNPGPNQTDLNHYRNYRTFKVTRAQIDDHIDNYNSSSYETPEDIRDWPAHGNPNAGESTCIAPFIDVNNDEIYDPNDGDYPQIRGDEAVYTVFNDLRHSPMRPIDPVGVEGHLMIYGYDSPDPVLSKTFFVNYRLINIGFNSYENLLTGINNRSGVGTFTDDFIGCDTLNNFYYYYNNDDFDDTALDQLGFGSNPPALGIIPLNKNLNSFVSWDGVSGSQTEIPYNKEFSVNFLKGWKNYGAAFYANSYRTVNPNQAYGDTTKFIFTGDPVQDTGWTHYRDSTFTFINNSYPVSNGTVGGLNHGDFNPGDTVEIDYAITIAENTGNTLYSEVADLRSQVLDIQNWYNNYQFDDWKHSCMLVNFTIPGRSIDDESAFKVYPNPNAGAFTLEIKSLKREASFQLFNSLGTLIKDGAIGNIRTDFNFSSLSSGVYLLKVNNGSQSSTQPILIK